MNKFVELFFELNFYVNWYFLLLVRFIFDFIYLCILISVFWIFFGMLCIFIVCNWMFFDLFFEFCWLVELWVVGVGEVLMFFLIFLEVVIIMLMIRSILISSKVKYFCGFYNLKFDGDFCLLVEFMYLIVYIF